uniref:Uncharacterized protein n=1 Tax=Picea glauca TaxID=3330 RepID=A0A117NI49_PICGL|nr:hypothetical protein ABT39_MTgene3947 [Picea glauca]
MASCYGRPPADGWKEGSASWLGWGWLELTALFAIYLPPTPRSFFCSIYSNPPFTTPSLLTTTLREGKPCTCLGRHF